MSIGLQGDSPASVSWGLASKIEIRQQGTGSFLDVGIFQLGAFAVDPITVVGDPSNTEYVTAIRYSGAFTLMQTALAKELTLIAGTAGTGLFDTDVEIKITFKGGRVITLGAVSGYPLRLVPGFVGGNGDTAQEIPCKFSVIEPYSGFIAKVA